MANMQEIIFIQSLNVYDEAIHFVPKGPTVSAYLSQILTNFDRVAIA